MGAWAHLSEVKVVRLGELRAVVGVHGDAVLGGTGVMSRRRTGKQESKMKMK